MQHPVRCGLVVATGIGVGTAQLEVVHQQVKAHAQDAFRAAQPSLEVIQRAAGMTADVPLDL